MGARAGSALPGGRCRSGLGCWDDHHRAGKEAGQAAGACIGRDCCAWQVPGSQPLPVGLLTHTLLDPAPLPERHIPNLWELLPQALLSPAPQWLRPLCAPCRPARASPRPARPPSSRPGSPYRPPGPWRRQRRRGGGSGEQRPKRRAAAAARSRERSHRRPTRPRAPASSRSSSQRQQQEQQRRWVRCAPAWVMGGFGCLLVASLHGKAWVDCCTPHGCCSPAGPAMHACCRAAPVPAHTTPQTPSTSRRRPCLWRRFRRRRRSCGRCAPRGPSKGCSRCGQGDAGATAWVLGGLPGSRRRWRCQAATQACAEWLLHTRCAASDLPSCSAAPNCRSPTRR